MSGTFSGFGQNNANNANNGSGSIFGNTNANQNTQTGSQAPPAFSFGGASTSGSTPFGQGSSSGNSGGLFGQSSGSTGFQLGNSGNAGQNTTANAPGPEKKDTPAFNFGSSSTPAFGQQSATTASNPPSSNPTSLFGGASSSGGLNFGQPAKKTQTEPQAQSFGLFGAKSEGQAQTAGTSSSEPKKFEGFGASFGNNASTDKSAAPQSFNFGQNTGSDKKPEGSTLFGQSSSTDAKPFSLSIAGKSDSGPSQPSQSLFGNSKADDKPAFGESSKPADTNPSQPSTSVFGGSKTENKPAFGQTTKLADKPADTNPSQPSTSIFGGSKTENKPAFGQTTKLADKPADKPLFSFGQSDKAEKPAETKSATNFFTGSTSQSGAPSGDSKPASSFSFASGQDSAKTDGAKPAAGFSFNQGDKAGDKPTQLSDKPSDKPAGSGLFGPSSEGQAPAKQTAELTQSNYLKNKSFEDIVAKWTSALSKSTTRFKSQAESIGQWDRVLAKNGAKISEVYTEVISAEQTQGRIDDLLNHLSRQQDDLEAMLSKYENQADEILPKGSANLQPVDQERKDSYELAEQANDKLNKLESQLSSVISEINKVTKDANHISDEDPIAQIVRVLNSHVASLEWIDESTSKLQEKLTQAYTQNSRMQF